MLTRGGGGGGFRIFTPIEIKLAKINKNYTQASENKLSSTRAWSVNNIMGSPKIHRLLETPVLWPFKIDYTASMSQSPKGGNS